jgi:hypothetical protein
MGPFAAAVMQQIGIRKTVLLALTLIAGLDHRHCNRRDDSDRGVAAAGDAGSGGAARLWSDGRQHRPAREGCQPITIAFNVLGTASTSGGFWLLFASFFVCGASTNGLIGTHLISYCIDHGLPEDLAAGTRIVRQEKRPDRVRLVAGTSSAPASSPSRPARCARSSATITSRCCCRVVFASSPRCPCCASIAAPSMTVSRPRDLSDLIDDLLICCARRRRPEFGRRLCFASCRS